MKATTIRVLFKKAQRDGHPVDDAISIWTKLFNWRTGPYAHVEVCWPETNGNFQGVSGQFLGDCFTSTMRGDINGTVIRSALDILKHPERWDVCEIPVYDRYLTGAKVQAQIAATLNFGYDIKCIMGFFLPWRIRNKKKNICSEAVQTFLYWCKIFRRKQVWSPRRLSAKLIAKGYKIVPLVEVQ